jgi:hypothetical protein
MEVLTWLISDDGFECGGDVVYMYEVREGVRDRVYERQCTIDRMYGRQVYTLLTWKTGCTIDRMYERQDVRETGCTRDRYFTHIAGCCFPPVDALHGLVISRFPSLTGAV